jgi:hypothetical protein
MRALRSHVLIAAPKHIDGFKYSAFIQNFKFFSHLGVFVCEHIPAMGAVTALRAEKIGAFIKVLPYFFYKSLMSPEIILISCVKNKRAGFG